MSKTYMNPIFSLKNFRSFGEDGADFELAPITVLTGQNSAGKSSLVKALMLLSGQSKKKAANLDEPNLEITEDPIGAELPLYSNELGLGSFKNILNESTQEERIEFKYELFSEYLNETIRVTKKFCLQPLIEMEYGRLAGVRIEKTDGALIYGYGEGCDPDNEELPLRGFLAKFAHMFSFDDNIVKNKNKDKVDWTKEEIDAERQKFLKEALLPPFLSRNTYIDSSSAIIKRLYSLDDNDKVSAALRKLFDRTRSLLEHVRKDSMDEKDLIPTDFIDHWIFKFEIGDRIEIVQDDIAGLGQYLFLVKGDKKRLLADEGYGITQLFALLLQIENNLPYHDFGDRNQPRYIFVEEPEVHLHPKFQSLLADMFVEAYQKYNIHFIIETHSEYLVRKLQVMVADKGCDLTSEEVSLNYVEKDEDGISTNRQIKILEDGRLSEPFGSGFFDETDKLIMSALSF